MCVMGGATNKTTQNTQGTMRQNSGRSALTIRKDPIFTSASLAYSILSITSVRV